MGNLSKGIKNIPIYKLDLHTAQITQQNNVLILVIVITQCKCRNVCAALPSPREKAIPPTELVDSTLTCDEQKEISLAAR